MTKKRNSVEEELRALFDLQIIDSRIEIEMSWKLPLEVRTLITKFKACL